MLRTLGTSIHAQCDAAEAFIEAATAMREPNADREQRRAAFGIARRLERCLRDYTARALEMLGYVRQSRAGFSGVETAAYRYVENSVLRAAETSDTLSAMASALAEANDPRNAKSNAKAMAEPNKRHPGKCNCEHDAHFGDYPADKFPEHPRHAYGADCEHVVYVRTLYGTYKMCPPCAALLPDEYKLPEGANA